MSSRVQALEPIFVLKKEAGGGGVPKKCLVRMWGWKFWLPIDSKTTDEPNLQPILQLIRILKGENKKAPDI